MIVKFSQLAKLKKSARKKKIVFAGGTFDLLHKGHIEWIKCIRKFGDILVIAVSSDMRVKQRKGSNRPILSQGERLYMLDSVKYIDYTTIAPDPSKLSPVPTMKIIYALKPNIFISSDNKWKLFKREVESLGTNLKIVPRVSITSTTSIINRIVRRYCPKKDTIK